MKSRVNNFVQWRWLLTLCCMSVAIVCSDAMANGEGEIRVVSTDNSSTALVFALGAEDKLVGIDSTSVLPSQSPQIAVVGYHRALSVEGLLALNPTVVIGNENMGPPDTLSTLDQAGIEISRLNNPESPDELISNIRLLAKQLGSQSQGELLLEKLNSQLASLGSELSTQGMTVVFFLSVAGNRLRMAGNGTGADSLIRLLGGKNAAGYENYRSMSAEAILAMQPDLILVTGEDQQSTAAQFLSSNPVLKKTPAGVSGRVFGIDSAAVVSGLGLVSIDEALRVSTLVSQTIPSKANNP